MTIMRGITFSFVALRGYTMSAKPLRGVRTMPQIARLYVFTFSHFSEKARWACDRKRLGYRLVPLMPGLHVLTTRRLAPRSCVPVLVHDQHVIQNSSEIIDYLDAAYPEDPLTPRDPQALAEARHWEPLLDRELGETVIRVFYHHALQSPRFLRGEYNRGGPFWSPWFYALALPLIQRAVRKKYDVTDANAAQALARLRALFQRLDDHFASRRYLAGDTFSRADLTLGALAAALISPPGHPAQHGGSRTAPAGWVELTQRFRDSLTAERVRELYRSERFAAPCPSKQTA